MEWNDEDLRELRETDPDAATIQLLSTNPLALTYDRLTSILKKINAALPKMEYIYAGTRVTDIRNKTVEQLKSLREMGLREISLGVESGNDWMLKRINKGYHASDILEQCAKLTEVDIQFWMTFLNGGQERNTARIMLFIKRNLQSVPSDSSQHRRTGHGSRNTAAG